MQRMSADPLTQCPSCAQDGLKKLISQTSFQLKGSGWYVTDYKGKKGSGAAPSDTPATSDAPAKPSPAPEAKPASASPAASGAD
jgi:predicted nucleic acid-binding Zn ribbon protein